MSLKIISSDGPLAGCVQHVAMGWATPLTQDEVDGDPPKNVVGVAVSKSFPDSAMIREHLERGIEQLGSDAVWVMREKPAADHACSIAWAVLREHGIEPLWAAPVSCFNDGRAWADAEMRQGCYRVIVFHDGRSETTKSWKNFSWRHEPYREGAYPCRARVFVVERGKAKARKRATRKHV